MSVEAISWALKCQIKQSSTKFVLVAMANCADSDMIAWPSLAYLAEATSQDRKTVLANMARLKESGYLEDTGERRGSTKQVVVYRLKSPEIGHVEDAQKRNSTENGTVPNFPVKGPVFPAKEARFSHETGPKTGHGTINEPSLEPSVNRHKEKFDPMAELQANGVTAETARDWLTLRKGKKAPVTATAIKQIASEAEKAGVSLEAALQTGCARGWVGFKAEWVSGQRAQAPPAASNANEEAKRLLGITQGDVIDV